MRYKIDEETIWEDTFTVKVHNYPPSPMTFSYVTKVYKVLKKNSFSLPMKAEGEPIYFHEMSYDKIAFAKIIAEAQCSLYGILPNDKYLKPIKND